jgi:hypothetical protein
MYEAIVGCLFRILVVPAAIAILFVIGLALSK